MKDKVLFLDFDGVLFDTLREVYLVGRCLHFGKSFFDEIDEKNYALYSKYKYLVYNIWMFYYYNPLIFGGCDDVESCFFEALLKRNIEVERDFCDKFLNLRADLVKNNYDFWKNLEKPYEFFWEIKKLYESKSPDIVIVSKKNKTSIEERFQSYGFNLPSSAIFAREVLDKYPSKAEFMAEYMKEKGYLKALFADDNYNNLKSCDNYPQIGQILALWGNSQPGLKGYDQNGAIAEIRSFFG